MKWLDPSLLEFFTHYHHWTDFSFSRWTVPLASVNHAFWTIDHGSLSGYWLDGMFQEHLVGKAYGSQSMAGPLQRVLMRSAASAMARAEASEWHYGADFDPQKAAAQHEALTTLVLASGAAIEWLTDADDGLADSVFTHDPSLMTDHGAIILAMGKALRRDEPGLHEAAYKRMGMPILGRIERSGTGRGRRLRLGRRTDAGRRPRRAHQPGRHPAARRTARPARVSRSTATTCRSGMARTPACI